VESQEYTSLVVPVQEANFIQPFRLKHLHRPGVTMPPHITLRSPFKPMRDIDRKVLSTLAELFGSHPQFRFVLAETAHFSDTGVLYLVPEPAEPFHVLSQAVQLQYPDPAPKHLRAVMHLTLARSTARELDVLEREFNDEYRTWLPIEATATEVYLFEKREASWVWQTSFSLSLNNS
jgi:2'-5' RNA ligase